MQYQVVHVTRYSYGSAVPIAYNRACLMPRACLHQECLRTMLRVEPQPSAVGPPIKDYYGNDVTYFEVQEPHDALVIASVSEVRILPTLVPMAESTPPWETVRDGLRTGRTAESIDAYQFSFDKEPLHVSMALLDYAAPSFAPGVAVLAGALDLMTRIHRDFSYDPTATTVTTPVEEVFRKRRGVCQDFASVQISCLRALGLAARYVSGYIAPVRSVTGEEFVGSQASHAWLAIYVPGHGWVDLDPTNNMIPTNEHITLAWGRYFEEVSPVRGVILGGSGQHLSVSVEVTRLGA